MLEYWTGIATLTGIYMIAILGVSILTGFTGMFSLGHAGFMAIGAYTSALLTKATGMPIILGSCFGMVAAGLIGLLISIPTTKLKGDYFVIASLGIGEVTKLIIENMYLITGGSRGLSDIPRGVSLPMVLVFDVLIIMLLWNFLHSKQGRNCIAVREEELAASSIGVNVAKNKLLAMVISSALCGLAGGLLAHYMRYLHPNMFNMAKSNELVIAVILGGCGSLTGSILAALVLIPLPEILRIQSFQEWRMVFYGLLLVLVIIFKPSGLLGRKEFSIRAVKSFFERLKPKKETRRDM